MVLSGAILLPGGDHIGLEAPNDARKVATGSLKEVGRKHVEHPETSIQHMSN